MRIRNRRWWFFWLCCFQLLNLQSADVSETIIVSQYTVNGKLLHSTSTPLKAGQHVADNSSRGSFSPRMDYEKWKPLGRGDPLQNDPTYDYLPPVLDRVHYWLNPSLRKPDSEITEKTEAPGPTSKKPQTERRHIFYPLLKFVDGPKIGRPTSYRRPPPFYSNEEKPGFAGKGERFPYTMLVPPPVHKKPDSGTQFQKPRDTTPITTTVSPPTHSAPAKGGSVVYLMHQDGSGASFGGASVMHKGEVTDYMMDVESTYVNIGKPSAQVDPPTDALQNIIINLSRPPNSMVQVHTSTSVPPSPVSADYPTTPPFQPTPVPPTTTPTPKLTTHHQHRQSDLTEPMYLIIQGHSRVKTYGALSNQQNEIASQETNELLTVVGEYSKVKHLNGFVKEDGEKNHRESRSKSVEVLQSDLSAKDDGRSDVQERELEVKYKVGPTSVAKDEKYHKGIVEAGRVS